MQEKKLCSECKENPIHPDTNPPLCLQCLQEKSECPPVGSGITPVRYDEQENRIFEPEEEE